MNAPRSNSAKACIYCATACSGTRKNLCGSAICAAAFAAQAKVDAGQRKLKSSEDVFQELSALAFLALAFIAPVLFG